MKVVTLKTWEAEYIKFLGIPKSMIDLYNDFRTYYLQNNHRMNNAENAAFRQFGYKLQSYCKANNVL